MTDVVADIQATGCRNILFADSMFAGKNAHAMELMEALIPLRLRWSTLWSAYVCLDQVFMDLAKRSGLLHVNIGVESLDQQTLEGMNKRFNKVSFYREVLANLRKRGISYSLNFIFGSDTDGEDVFTSTLAFLEEERVPVAYFNILTPHRGTPLYERMRAESRILDEDQIGRWPGLNCYFKPLSGTPEELERRIKEIRRRFFSLPSMLRRLPLPVTQANIASWVVNVSERKVARAEEAMENFDEY